MSAPTALYAIQHTPSKTYFPIRHKHDAATDITTPFEGPPRLFTCEADAQNSLRWHRNKLVDFDSCIIVKVSLRPTKVIPYVGGRR